MPDAGEESTRQLWRRRWWSATTVVVSIVSAALSIFAFELNDWSARTSDTTTPSPLETLTASASDAQGEPFATSRPRPSPSDAQGEPSAIPGPRPTLLAAITAQPAPLPDSASRASGNFSLSVVPEGAAILRWTIDGGEQVSFDVVEDVSFGIDRIVLADVTDGSVSQPISSEALYLASPVGAAEPFTVRVYAE